MEKKIGMKASALILSAVMLAGMTTAPVMAGTAAGGGTVKAVSVSDRTPEAVDGQDEPADGQTAEDPTGEEQSGIIKVFLVRQNTKVRINGRTLRKRGWFYKKSVDGEMKTVAMVPLKAVADVLGARVTKISDGWTVRSGDREAVILKEKDCYLFSDGKPSGKHASRSYGAAPVISEGAVYIPADVFEDLYSGSEDKMSVKLNARKNILTFNFRRSGK